MLHLKLNVSSKRCTGSKLQAPSLKHPETSNPKPYNLDLLQSLAHPPRPPPKKVRVLLKARCGQFPSKLLSSFRV